MASAELLLRETITSDVCAARSIGSGIPTLIERLRTYERTAHLTEMDAQTMQVILSGRRLLGDNKTLKMEHSRSAIGGKPRAPFPQLHQASRAGVQPAQA